MGAKPEPRPTPDRSLHPQAFLALAAFDAADATTCISSSNPLDNDKEYFAASDRVAVDGDRKSVV